MRLTAPRATLDDTASTAIVDNRARTVGGFLSGHAVPESLLSVVSAYFTIYGYGDLRTQLDRIGRMRLLYGDPRGVSSLDPEEAEDNAFRLTDEGNLELTQALRQKPLARACADWIERKADIRTITQSNFLHGKMYHITKPAGSTAVGGDTAALVGSSNFTRRGLGMGSNPNLELNLEVRSDSDRRPLLEWFNELWHDEELTHDAKQDVLDALARLGKDYSPEFVYYKTLFHVLGDRLAQQEESERLAGGVHLFDSSIWNQLYEFQRHGVISAINRLLLHNGCIVADSVGLGKTFTALGVIKYFESRNERVLVLCPSRLKPNWLRYPAHTAQRTNPFLSDRFGYTVLAHTDLSRTKGMAGDIDLANFNWSAFDLIVIDESHNFRNEGREKRDEEDNLISRSRYRRLLEELLKEGAKTKVLMLSATPVNTSLRDLRNQIYLMTEKREHAFQELGVGSIQSIFARAQKEFQKWEKRFSDGGTRDKAVLLERLGADFLAVLDAVTIARSRHHIRTYYPDFEKEHGAFPERAKPKNLHPATDTRGKLSYDQLHEVIGNFQMAVYMPSQYVTDPTDLDEERKKLNFDQRDREKWLIGMIRVNLLKRLESSVDSFALTMERIIAKMDEVDALIERWEATGEGRHQFGIGFNDDEDEEFTLGQGSASYGLESLDVRRLQRDLRKDRDNFRAIREQARTVTPERDGKLRELRRVLTEKVIEAPKDKEGRPNRKALVFTTFSDTARYLYENLEEWAREAGVNMALVAGSARNRATVGSTRFEDILARFSPRSQLMSDSEPAEGKPAEVEDEIDIVIATDCLSEGQNLQDCDLVVNYDIHWNPVRLMQRLGRIDRIGSTNHQVRMVNFWPTKDLDRYLDLKNRVEARMMLADAAGTGTDDPLALEEGEDGVDKARKSAEEELKFRDRQLKKLREETLDIEDVDDGVSLSDFTLDDFLADLANYLQRHKKALEEAPFGIFAVAPPWAEKDGVRERPKELQPGAVFCLEQKRSPKERTPNRLQPYFLVYVREDGIVRYTFQNAKEILGLFGAVARGRDSELRDLVDVLDSETEHGQRMAKYDRMVMAALRSIVRPFRKKMLTGLTQSRGAKISKRSEQPRSGEDFELVTWLVIREEAGDA